MSNHPIFTLALHTNLLEVRDHRGVVVARGSSFRDGTPAEQADYVRRVTKRPRATVYIDGEAFAPSRPAARYRITNRVTGVDHGVFTAGTGVEALAAMFQDAGYDVRAAGNSLVSDPETLAFCAPDAWEVERLPSRAQARRQAHRESHMYRQGRQWVVVTRDDKVPSKRDAQPTDWSSARNALSAWRRKRAAHLAGETG